MRGGFAIISATKNYYPILAYSDKGVFDLPVEIPGLLNWLNKTKDAVRMSEIFTDSIKIKMQSLWSHYEKSETASFEKIQKKQSRYTPTNGEVACWNRCDELQMKYGGEGWSFLPLDQTQSVFESAGFYNIYDDLCFGAEFNHSPLNCSVVGWKNVYETTQVGPLLSTKWHQGSPFNDLCGGKSAGCAAVAVAQVMSYYKYPMSFTLNGYTFSWNTLPDIPTSNSDHAALLKLVGEFVDTNYGALGSWTTPNNLENGIRSLGYNVTKADHNYERVERELLNYKHPVIMGGNDTNLPLPSPLDYIGQSHYWVCEGALERLTNQVLYFTEWQPNGSGTFVTGWNTINNPGILGGIHYLYFYMNWGWGGKHDGWFAFNDVNSGEGDYEHSRLDFYISKP